MPLPPRPACAPIARGLMPHASASAATRLLLAMTPDLLVWPRLARRNGQEIDLRYSLAGFPGLVSIEQADALRISRAAAEILIDRLALAYLRNDLAAGTPSPDQLIDLAEFVRTAGLTERSRVIVCETLGPVSMAISLIDEHDRPLIYDPELREAIIHHVALRARWQVNHLKMYAAEVVICLDEPMLDALDSPFCPLDRDEGLAMIDRVFSNLAGVRGLAPDGVADWSAVLDLPLDLVFCNACEHESRLLAAAHEFCAFIQRGGVIAWGIVSADNMQLGDESIAACLARFDQLLGALEHAGATREQVLRAALITTSGSLAHVSIETAEQALQFCAEAAVQLRTIYHV